VAQILVLDAMGILHQAGDDVGELLMPFVAKHGHAGLSAEAIDLAYTEASLGGAPVDCRQPFRTARPQETIRPPCVSLQRRFELVVEAQAAI
jgi:hypothetical protein